MKKLVKDPLNVIIIGVAGQGNVVISYLISQALMRDGYLVSFGNVYGSNQRGGPVMNYVRISQEITYGPFIPEGHGDIILGMEPVEALRMLGEYGNPDVVTIVNPRPIYSIDISGTGAYPEVSKVIDTIKSMSAKTWVINATDEAQKLGNPILSNVILVGALIGSGGLPLDRSSIEPILKERFPKAFELNMKAFDRGVELVTAS
ncbi:MAG: indolepyruvate oxidoreductase subunit beta [Dehalococcoidales bacterium]|nr:indolepyruvate oxidoreductase subunit beta [Dehalococcoidales bacterium]